MRLQVGVVGVALRWRLVILGSRAKVKEALMNPGERVAESADQEGRRIARAKSLKDFGEVNRASVPE